MKNPFAKFGTQHSIVQYETVGNCGLHDKETRNFKCMLTMRRDCVVEPASSQTSVKSRKDEFLQFEEAPFLKNLC